jgi:uroporphyrinogen decarboxylase
MSTSSLSSRERCLLAISRRKADRVPVMPDMSNMIPCRHTGRPFWDIYLHRSPTVYEAYSRIVDYYGIDGWFQTSDSVVFEQRSRVETTSRIVSKSSTRLVEQRTHHTSHGNLDEEITYYIADPPTRTRKLVKDVVEDFLKVKEMLSPVTGYDASLYRRYKALRGERGIFCTTVGYPGMHYWSGMVDGGLSAAVYAQADHEEIFDEWAFLHDRYVTSQMEIYLSLEPDVILIGASGTLTLSSPELVRRYCLPTIKKLTAMARQAGVPTMLHSCGKSAAFLPMLADETDLDCVNPLEEPPMGDVYLRDVKQRYGQRLSLMGNLNTTDVMLRGSPGDVEKAARKAIDDAGRDGGFILSTGDQCGRDTPDRNIFALVETAKAWGRY